MSLSESWKTYSFDSDGIVQILKELVKLLEEMGVDVTDRKQLKAGLDRMFNIEYHGLPDMETQRWILAPNHVSDFDALIIGLMGERIRIMSKSAWVDNPKLMGFLSMNYDLIGVDRSTKVSQARALVELIKYLSAPGPVRHALMFPQGTISDLNNNSDERVQAGVFGLSQKAGVPVLPIFIEQVSFDKPTRIVCGAPMPMPSGRQDCRAAWRSAVLALQDGLEPPARRPVLTEKHANNNRPGEPYFEA